MRESPALRIIELLQRRGASMDYHHSHILRQGRMRKYEFGPESVALTAETLRQYNCALMATDHTAYDYDFIVKESSLVTDPRNTTGSSCKATKR